MKTLCVDLGNTRMKAAVFEDATLIHSYVLENDALEHIRAMIAEFNPQKSILSSVVHHDKKLEEVLSSSTHFHLLNHQSKLNFTIPVGKPETMGADRLALAAAAVHFFPKQFGDWTGQLHHL
jgi:type III pantothenate kinase